MNASLANRISLLKRRIDAVFSKFLIGVDIGTQNIKVAALQKRGDRWMLEGVARRKLPPGAIVEGTYMQPSTVSRAIQDAVSQLSLKGRQVATSVRGRSVILRTLIVPEDEPEYLEESVATEVERVIPFDLNEVNFDFQVMGSLEDDPSQLKILLVASRRDIIEEARSTVAEAGLEPLLLDVHGFALANLYEQCDGIPPEEPVLLVDIGASFMTLIALEGGFPLFLRDLPLGGKNYTEELQRRFGWSHEIAEQEKKKEILGEGVEEVLQGVSLQIASEMEQTIDFFSSSTQRRIFKNIYLTGGAAGTRTLQESLQQRLHLSVEVFDPFEKLSFDLDVRGDMPGPQFAVALGLAMRGGL